METAIRNQLYTLDDYLSWDSDERYELMDGVAYLQAAPSIEHQSIVAEITRQLSNILKGGKCVAIPAPLDVVIDSDETTVVQPDISVICDMKKVIDGKYYGAPTIVFEVVSPSSSSRDYIKKLIKYRDCGVGEYWIVDYLSKSVTVYSFSNNELKLFEDGEIVNSEAVQGLYVNFAEVFAEFPWLSGDK